MNSEANGNLISKDEMNLLEFCVFSATNRVDFLTKSLEFEVPPNRKRGSEKKNLKVAFSAEYGRPTCRDDLVLVGLMKISNDQRFANQRVEFTRYQLLKTLGWRDEAKNYARIDAAFDRLRGVHLNLQNAFWDNREKVWVSRKFGIIDDVEIIDRKRYEYEQRQGNSRPKCWFKWSDVMFESFESGYIKTLDLEFLSRLNGSVAKRLYRLLDKRFNNKRVRLPVRISLNELAVKKLGFRPNKPSHHRRMIEPAIEELIEARFLDNDSIRLEKKLDGYWLSFSPDRGKSSSQHPRKRGARHNGELTEDRAKVMAKLIELGVEPGFSKQNSAGSLAMKYDAKRSMKFIEYFREKNAKSSGQEKSVGWLIACIRCEKENGFLPDSYQSGKQRQLDRIAERYRKQKQVGEKRKRFEQSARSADTEFSQFRKIRDSFSKDEQLELERNALEGKECSFLIPLVEGEKDSGRIGKFHELLWNRHIIPNIQT